MGALASGGRGMGGLGKGQIVISSIAIISSIVIIIIIIISSSSSIMIVGKGQLGSALMVSLHFLKTF